MIDGVGCGIAGLMGKGDFCGLIYEWKRMNIYAVAVNSVDIGVF